MDTDKLNISIIYGDGLSFAPLSDLLNNLPLVEATEQFHDVEAFLRKGPENPPDSVVVYLNGLTTPPQWIETLCRKFPQVPVLACSEKLEADFLMRAMQLGVREILPLPLTREVLEGALQRVQLSKQRLATAHAQGDVVAVTGHKGGSGTTTIAINLAVALEELSAERCALVDLGRPFPDIGNFLDLDSTYDLGNVIHNLDSLDQSFFQRIMQPYANNLDILHGISDFKEQDSLDLEGVGRIFSILRGLYQYIVVDLGHLFDELFFRVFQEADLVLMLTEVNVPNIRNLRKLWPTLKDWDQGRKKLKVVVNRHYKGNDLGMRELERIIDEPPLAILTSDYHPLLEAMNKGVPLAEVRPSSQLYLGIKDVAQKIIRLHRGEEKSTNGAARRRRFWIF
ncbi:MAG: cellulose synthase operon protein YhjQ/BcsQ [Desulfobaccales bacterium]